jgi:hypothetical protein
MHDCTPTRAHVRREIVGYHLQVQKENLKSARRMPKLRVRRKTSEHRCAAVSSASVVPKLASPQHRSDDPSLQQKARARRAHLRWLRRQQPSRSSVRQSGISHSARLHRFRQPIRARALRGAAAWVAAWETPRTRLQPSEAVAQVRCCTGGAVVFAMEGRGKVGRGMG